MLYQLLYSLSDHISLFNVFRYITFRTAAAGATSFLLCIVLGPTVIRILREMSIGQSIREEGPSSHQSKSGTPTMGGILIVVSVLVASLLWANLENPFVWIQLVAMLGFSAVGYMDDRAKVLKRHNLGLTAKAKFFWLGVIAVGVAGAMVFLAGKGFFTTELFVPFNKKFHPELGLLFVPFAVLVLLGTSNAVNLTDGLDGLAIGASGVAFATYTLIAYVASHADMSEYLNIPHIVSTGELVVFGGAMCGACMGFLWYNAHPAEMFMGDTGALGLGGSLGCLALLSGHPLLLVIVGGLFVVEAVSVILQVGSYKWRRKRIFRMAPIHHHFELKGWHESKVIIRFWIVSILFAILALSTFKVR